MPLFFFMIFFSPAKVNLQLSLHGKRSDGYYEIETRMHTIDLFDRLHFTPVDRGFAFSCSDSSIPSDASNLVVKAVLLFQNYTGVCVHYRIRLQKQIPAGAGLGGGSGNAATTLYALNRLYKTNLCNNELVSLAAQIGSDIPFFFSSEGSAICRGRGEIVEDAPSLTGAFLLFCPPFSLSTKQVYAKYGENMQSAERYRTVIMGQVWNDLEAPAYSLSPKLLQLRKEWQSLGYTVMMSGSGSTLMLFGEGNIPKHLLPYCKTVSLIKKNVGNWYLY